MEAIIFTAVLSFTAGLPGWDVVVKRCSDGSGEAYLIDPNYVYQQPFGHHVAALAIMRATVAAMIAKHTIRDLKKELNDDDLAIVEIAERHGATLFPRDDKWLVSSAHRRHQPKGLFSDIVEAAKAFCEANNVPLPSSSGPSLR